MIFLLFDSAKNGVVSLTKLKELYPQWESLFNNTADEIIFDVAPYLFEVDEMLMEKVTNERIDFENIFFIKSKESLENLVVHFQQFLYRRNSEGKMQYFRFWDAKVAEPFLIKADKTLLSFFFGKIETFLFPDKLENYLRLYFLEQQACKMRKENMESLFSPFIENDKQHNKDAKNEFPPINKEETSFKKKDSEKTTRKFF